MTIETSDQANVQLIEHAYASLASGDVQAFFGSFDRELRFHFMRAVPAITGTHERLRGWINGMITPLLAVTNGTFSPRPRWLRSAGDELVLGHFDVSFEFDGRRHEIDAVLVFRVAEGRIAEVWDIATPDTALAAELGAALSAHLAAAAQRDPATGPSSNSKGGPVGERAG